MSVDTSAAPVRDSLRSGCPARMTVRRLPGKAIGLIRRHPAISIVVGVAGLMRLLTMLAYSSAFYFPDSNDYVDIARGWYPHNIRPYGYSAFLKPFLYLPVPGPYETIALVQHLLVLGLMVLGYAFLVRRGVRKWLAALAMVPIALDARHITAEHHVVAETLYIVLTATGFIALMWQERLTTRFAVVGGVLLAGAALTRTIGLPLIGLALVYLLIRRVGWRPVLGATSAIGVLLGGYMVYYHHFHGVYGFNSSQGRILASRVMTIVDCEHDELTDAQRSICPPQPIGQRAAPDGYLWDPSQPIPRLYPSSADDPFLREFAMTVIAQQPGDYVAMVLEETGWHFSFSPPVNDYGRCIIRSWTFPVTPNVNCQARMYTDRGPVPDAEQVPTPANPLSTALERYSRFGATPGPLLFVFVLLGLAGLVWRPRRPGYRGAIEAAVFTLAGLGTTVLSVATLMYDMRYLMPALFLLPVGAALGLQRIWPTPVTADQA